MMFETVADLRRDLCKYVVNCNCTININGHESQPCQCWDEYDKKLIGEWVRCNVIQGPKKVGRAKSMNATEFLKQAKRLGCEAVRSKLYDGYKLPCVKSVVLDGSPGSTIFTTYIMLLDFLSRFGLPHDCSFDALTENERFELEAFLACRNRGTL
jgi:hypothetical protein